MYIPFFSFFLSHFGLGATGAAAPRPPLMAGFWGCLYRQGVFVGDAAMNVSDTRRITVRSSSSSWWAAKTTTSCARPFPFPHDSSEARTFGFQMSVAPARWMCSL
jgi:hypothetical protein